MGRRAGKRREGEGEVRELEGGIEREGEGDMESER